MSDEVEVIKSPPDAQAFVASHPLRTQRKSWIPKEEEENELRTILSPLQTSSGGERSPAFSDPTAVTSPNDVLSPISGIPHSKSFDSSSISSKTSKRTSTSQEMSSLIRQRVRQQARSLVDKKRGSVQLAKRLLRTQTLQSADIPFSPDDYEATDRQVEGSLALGAKYINSEHSVVAPENIQRLFFTPVLVEEQPKEKSGSIVKFEKPKGTERQRAEFASQLTIVRPAAGDSLNRAEWGISRRIRQKELRMFLHRHGDHFAELSDETILSDKIERIWREEDEDFALVEYSGPRHWDDDLNDQIFSKYFQLNIDLNHLEFDHHWLFSAEDVLSRRLRTLHSEYVEMTERMVYLFDHYTSLRQRAEIEVSGENETEQTEKTLSELKKEMDSLRLEIPKVGNLMESAYGSLRQFWANTGIISSEYRLERIDNSIILFKGSMGCGEMGKSPFLSGRLFCSAVWIEGNTLGNEGRRRDISQSSDYFALIPTESILCDSKTLNSDIRLEALHRRYRNRHSAKSTSRRIGLTASEVDHSFLTDERSTDFQTAFVGTRLSLDAFYELGLQYAVSVRTNLTESIAFGRRSREYHDLVREETIPVLFDFIGTLFRPPDISRKLKPMRNIQRSKVPSHGGFRVIVNIQSATNLPERIDGESTNIFVEVIFKKQRVQTSTVEGRFANWQETMVLDLERENELGFDLADVNENFELRLYDRLISPLDYDNRETNTIHEQTENRWLGNLVIPFGTVFALGKLEGSLTVQKALFHSEYRNLERNSQLKVLITTDPPVMSPKLLFNEILFDGESPTVIEECIGWAARCSNRHPDRGFPALVSDTNGKSVCIIRYVQPLSPPSFIYERFSVNSLKGCLIASQCVSAIPLVTHPVVFAFHSSVWMTIDQTLTIGCGNSAEKGILLVSWLLGLGVNAVLCLGTSLPEGPMAAFVFVHLDDHPPFLLSPSDGLSYSLEDPNCPMFQLNVAVTPKNAFGNIQSVAHPSQVDFNFTRHSNWEPLFTDNREMESVQPTSMEYPPVSEDLIVELRSTLEREIRVQFDQNRPYGIPQWNVLASRALREALAEMAETDSRIDIRQKFSQMGLPYSVNAVAFQKGYSTKERMIEAVLATQMHINANPLAQFAFAVHIRPFFGNVVGCSLAVGSLQTAGF